MNEESNKKIDKNRIIEIVLVIFGIVLLVVGVVLIFKHMNNEPIIKKKDTIIDEKESRYSITKNSSQQQFYSNEYQIVDNEKKQPLDELLEIGQNPIIAFEKLNGRYYAFVAEGLRIRIFLASEAKEVRKIEAIFSEVTKDGLVRFEGGTYSGSEPEQIVWSPQLESSKAYKSADAKLIAENNGKVTACNTNKCTIIGLDGKTIKEYNYKGVKKVGFGSIVTQDNNKLIIYSDEGKELYQRAEPKTISDVFYREDKDRENNYLIVVLGDNHIELKPYLSYSPEKKLVEEK